MLLFQFSIAISLLTSCNQLWTDYKLLHCCSYLLDWTQLEPVRFRLHLWLWNIAYIHVATITVYVLIKSLVYLIVPCYMYVTRSLHYMLLYSSQVYGTYNVLNINAKQKRFSVTCYFILSSLALCDGPMEHHQIFMCTYVRLHLFRHFSGS